MDIFMRQLRALIKKLLIELSPNNIFLQDILQGQRSRALAVQATEALQLIRELQDSLYKVEYSDNWPLLRILIAFCYCRLNDVHTARLWAEDAVRILNATNEEGNLALAYWFLAEIYAEEGYFKDSREQYVNAQKTFHQIRNNAPNSNAGYRLKKECSKRIQQIHRRIAGVSHERPRLLDSARKDQKVNIGVEDQAAAAEQTNERSSASNVLIAPVNVNVHVPIDNRFADHIDQKSLHSPPLHKGQSIDQEQDSMSGTGIPSAIDFTNATKQPSYSSLTSVDNRNTADMNNKASKPTEVLGVDYLMTPSLPIYGGASAGPNGEVVLEEPNYNAAIDESTFVRLDGAEYKVYSLRRDTRRIKISHKDFLTSLIPRKMREMGRKAYGWLRVTGNSMNEGKPIKNTVKQVKTEAGDYVPLSEDKRVKIENGDYVLFIEHNSVDDSIGKIVIVSESLPDSGPIRLLVKLLVRENNQFLLRSYSRDKNPDTEEEFEALDFNDCYQLIGEVIAVAKPRPAEQT